MKSLPEQLNDLAEGAKKTEDFVNAVRAKNRAVLEAAHESLKTSIANGEARMDADAAAAQDTARSWWNDTRQSIHARAAQLRAQREVKKAERRAEDAELDAAYALDFALAMLDEAEYAVADAAVARMDADELAARELV